MTTAEKPTTTREKNYHRALQASYEIRALDKMVRLIAELGPPRRGKPMWYACIWEQALKPMATLVVGWQRGRGAESANDPDGGGKPFYTDVGSMLDDIIPPRQQATSETEKWLRGSEAFDAVTDVWLKLLEDADPSRGHGLPITEPSA